MLGEAIIRDRENGDFDTRNTGCERGKDGEAGAWKKDAGDCDFQRPQSRSLGMSQDLKCTWCIQTSPADFLGLETAYGL